MPKIFTCFVSFTKFHPLTCISYRISNLQNPPKISFYGQSSSTLKCCLSFSVHFRYFGIEVTYTWSVSEITFPDSFSKTHLKVFNSMELLQHLFCFKILHMFSVDDRWRQQTVQSSICTLFFHSWSFVVVLLRNAKISLKLMTIVYSPLTSISL